MYGQRSAPVKPDGAEANATWWENLRAEQAKKRSAGRGRRGRWLGAAAALALVTACASGGAVRPSPTAVGPAPADAQLVVTLRQPLAGDLMTRLDDAGGLPPQLTGRAAELSDLTARMVLSLLPEGRGVVLALVPRETYPSELIGWQLNVSNLHFAGGGDSGVRRYWSNPRTGFGVMVFPNLIYSFWLAPEEFAAGATEGEPGPAVREMLHVAWRGTGVTLHHAAAPLSEAHVFAYLQDVAGFAARLAPSTPGTARAMTQLPAEAAWAAGDLAGPEPDAGLTLQAGLAVQTDDPAPYLALTRLLVVTLLSHLDLLGADALRGVRVGEDAPGTIAVRGLRLPRDRLARLLGAALEGEDGVP